MKIDSLVIASHNEHKISEIKTILQDINCCFYTAKDLQSPAALENGLTFVENALLKAREAAKLTDYWVLAEDSGLVVPALNGKPGLYSARFAGENASDEDNVKKLLIEMSNIVNRKAFYICVIVLLRNYNDPSPIICEGRWHGEIGLKPTGNNGFGYDPIFWPLDKQCSVASLPGNTKNSISHRSLALKKLQRRLSNS